MVRQHLIARALPGIAALVLACCSSTDESIQLAPGLQYLGPPPRSWSDSVLSTMTLEQRVGQMLMVGISGHFVSRDGAEYARAMSLVRDRKVGGVVLWQSDVYEAAILLNELQQAAAVPLLVGADFERGPAMRVRRATSFPDAMAIAATRDPRFAYRAARATAVESRAIGVHQNFAPVADVNTNPANPVINTRAFSDELSLVSEMVASYVQGTSDGGAIATLKHFPGHGDTGLDSHLDLPLLPYTRSRLDSLEVAAFRPALNAAGAVMVGHLAVPALDGSGLPASLSGTAIDGVLRRELGFAGLVLTDAMDMQGVARGYSVSESTVRAVNAGVDIVVLPADEEVAFTALVEAVRSGDISRDRLDACVLRILSAKERLGLPRTRTVEVDRIANLVSTNEHRALSQDIARRAITIIRNDSSVLPLLPRSGNSIAIAILSDSEDNRIEINRPGPRFTNEPAGAYLAQLFQRRNGQSRLIKLTPSSRAREIESALQEVGRAKLAVIALYVKVRTSSGRISVPENMRGFVDGLKKQRTPVVVVAFGTPYALANFPSAKALVCAYGDSEPLVEASVEALYGEIDVSGKLPVHISDQFPFGSGIAMPASVLRKEEPALRGYSLQSFAAIDDLIEAAVRDSAFPGAQLAIVKDGALLYSKSYGTATYERSSREITSQSMYDLASLTKVVSTTSAIMKLVDTGRLGIDDSVSAYLSEFATDDKRGITIRQLLMHRGGFPAYRKFFELCHSPDEVLDSIAATPLAYAPGDSTLYSDLGFITLGKLVEKITGLSLADYAAQEWFAPLGMSSTLYTPPQSMRSRVVPTEVDSAWRKSLVHGVVHDENAAFLGGVSGHAGLFSTATDLSVFVQMLLNKGAYAGRQFVGESIVWQFVGSRPVGQRYLGWDFKSTHGSSAGSLFSDASFGHTGFTGTSIWIDPTRLLGVIFLTNRVHPTRLNAKVFKIRPALHDAVMRAVETARPAGEQQ